MNHEINWKARFNNPVFIAQLVLAVLTPLLAYVGLSFEDLTTWGTLWELVVEAVSLD
ncbi:hypothetical protein J14TS2_52210 [Bacillus sp. J14TS2]|uniref:phage holin n=1 Tax=Bacillus sp. J14TS2 TaxID=2807188 RepID=UPI001B2E062B|nr:phage holin [Bacillus sp. J14TS2]GIN74746.1 hypothetical protein J14TS2_52210 [Bacillus sp. J14TS2]